ncbi:MAG TPA: DUF1592 domain-containing protein [Polyangiaceae bacterium]|nr:DUF1592 domain-containing protein [Polyangiaceae bacterium]
MRKITDSQYARLVTALLPGITPEPVTTPGTETARIIDDEGFVVRGPLAGQYWDGAVSAAAQAVENLEALMPCSPIPSDPSAQRACATAYVSAFLPRAFRRPVSGQEIDEYLTLFDGGAQTSFQRGIELVLTGVLQSADFLYRTELGTAESGEAGERVPLTSYEVASVLSFTFLGEGPDSALWSAAESGALTSHEGVEAEIQRLLSLPEAQERVTQITSTVLGVDGALTSARSAESFPELTADLRQAMADEVNRFVSDNLWSQQPLSELFTSRKTTAAGPLAAFYGIQGGATELPAGERAGILTRAATLLSIPTGSRAVRRGLFVAERYLCRDITPPPPAIAAEIQQVLALGLSERELVELRAGRAECAGCHTSFDSVGLSFEHYDEIGRFLTERDGIAVDASGQLVGTDVDGAFSDVAQLSELFSTSNDVAACLVEKFADQALGRKLEASEVCALGQVIEPWLATQKPWLALMPLVATSDLFLTRRREE